MKHPQAEVLIAWLEDTSRVLQLHSKELGWTDSVFPLISAHNGHTLRLAPVMRKLKCRAWRHVGTKPIYVLNEDSESLDKLAPDMEWAGPVFEIEVEA